MKKRTINRKIRIKKKYNLKDLMEYVEKNAKPHPNFDVLKWMKVHGR